MSDRQKHSRDRHRCPRRGCPKTVDNRLFCCHEDWFALSAEARREISRTAKMSLLTAERRSAIEVARQEWDSVQAAE